MAKEWYLMSPPHDQISGYEDEAFSDYGEEGFLELLDSNIADTVTLCNYDLSICKEVKAIVENKMQDTKLQSISRLILLPIGSCKAGMYVKYKDKYWLIVGNVDDNMIYEKGIMVLCNYLLTWTNPAGDIVQRWANCVSASQYNNGETGMKYYFVRSDQLLISIPDDDESLLLSTGARFVIDKRCKVYEKGFSDDVEKCTDKPLVVYELTRSDSVLYDYQDSGHVEFIAYQDEQRPADGYYRINGVGYWLCDQSYKQQGSDGAQSKIIADSSVIYCGIEPSTFTAEFTDDSGNVIAVDPNWEIKCDFSNKLDVECVENSIIISTDADELIGKSFKLVLSADGYSPVELTVKIAAFF